MILLVFHSSSCGLFFCFVRFLSILFSCLCADISSLAPFSRMCLCMCLCNVYSKCDLLKFSHHLQSDFKTHRSYSGFFFIICSFFILQFFFFFPFFNSTSFPLSHRFSYFVDSRADVTLKINLKKRTKIKIK